MTFKWKQFEAKDIDGLIPSEIYEESFVLLKNNAKSLEKNIHSYAISVYLNDKIVACIGLMVIWDGNAECWTVASDEVKKHPVAFHKFVFNTMKIFEDSLNLRRISANTSSKTDKGRRWLESLGFRREGLMLNYGPEGQDWWLYARTKL